MPAVNKKPVTQLFTLVKTDEAYGNEQAETDPTTCVIRQASNGDNEKRSQMWDIVNHKFSLEDGNMVMQTIDYGKLRRLEVFLTLADCNFLANDGKPMFRFKDGRLDMTQDEFDRAWGSVTDKTFCDEVHEKVIEVNTTWNTTGN